VEEEDMQGNIDIYEMNEMFESVLDEFLKVSISNHLTFSLYVDVISQESVDTQLAEGITYQKGSRAIEDIVAAEDQEDASVRVKEFSLESTAPLAPEETGEDDIADMMASQEYLREVRPEVPPPPPCTAPHCIVT
jgi:hypothetical protein